jgi:Xaa-Pro aminopeptidase
MSIALRLVTLPDFGSSPEQPKIPPATYEARCRAAYAAARCDWLVVYGDREHFGNIAFLSGFDPRFEEALLLLGPGGRRVLLTGNECESYAVLAGLPEIEVLVAQSLSLMAQDRSRHPRLADRLRDAGIRQGDTIGLAGWKYLEAEEDEDPATAFYVPAAHVQMLRRVVGKEGTLRDATPVLMHPETGLRARLDADQIAAFEWAATRCSLAVWRIVSGVREGDSEYEAVARMGYAGDPLNVHTMLASAGAGEPVIGLRSATGRRLRRGDGVTTAIGLFGALSSRAGLLDTANDEFLGKASGYFTGLLAWYAAVDVGAAGGDIHATVADKLAEAGLASSLNPGHLTGHEEWLHSPIRPHSMEKLRSGMPFQVDIIPTPIKAGWALNCEDPVVLADAQLRAELAEKHPEAFARITARRDFMRAELGVALKDTILPLSSTPLYLPPFWLKAEQALVSE